MDEKSNFVSTETNELKENSEIFIQDKKKPSDLKQTPRRRIYHNISYEKQQKIIYKKRRF